MHVQAPNEQALFITLVDADMTEMQAIIRSFMEVQTINRSLLDGHAIIRSLQICKQLLESCWMSRQ